MENQTIAPYSIWIKAYEREMDEQNGIQLRNLRNGKVSGLEDKADSFVPIFPNNPNTISDDESPQYSWEDVKEVLDKNEEVPGYCSMLIEDQSELFEHIFALYQTMYFHYMLGKSENMRKQFPNWCCGVSSTNLRLSLMKKGYANATELITAKSRDHTYFGLPFVLENSGEKGFIIGDPTSDQLWWKNPRIIPPRNHIFLSQGDEWEYKTDWREGGDLFPERFANLSTLRETKNPNKDISYEIEKYFKKVFENPIKLNISQE